MIQAHIFEVKGHPYQVKMTWVVDVLVATDIGTESTHIFCKSYIDAMKVKSGDFLCRDVQ